MKETIYKGTFGTVVPIVMSIAPLQIEVWLRILSLCIGIAVGLITFAGLVKRWNKR